MFFVFITFNSTILWFLSSFKFYYSFCIGSFKNILYNFVLHLLILSLLSQLNLAFFAYESLFCLKIIMFFNEKYF